MLNKRKKLGKEKKLCKLKPINQKTIVDKTDFYDRFTLDKRKDWIHDGL